MDLHFLSITFRTFSYIKLLSNYTKKTQYLFIKYIYSVPLTCFGVQHIIFRGNLRTRCFKPPGIAQLLAMVNTVVASWNTGLFVSSSGISELDCTTIKTDTAERSISI